MRCYLVHSDGIAGLKMDERPAGEPGVGEALVDVYAVSLNYRDLLVVKGQYGRKPSAPFIACSDMAGVVAKTGPDVETLKEGDRVVNAPFRRWPAGKLRSDWMRTFVGAAGVDGVLAEQVIYPAESLVKMPASYSFAEGATLTVAGLTAWAGIHTHGRTRPGDWVLLHGTGGVSIFSAQLARILGARTILTTSSPDKSRVVKERFGVAHTLDYRDAAWHEQARDITDGQGVDVVIDVASGQTFAQSLKACANHARVSLIGILGGYEATFNPFDIIRRQITVRGIYMESTEELNAFARACETNGLHPCIDRVFPFDQARQAYEYLDARKHIGKVVIAVRDQA